MDISFEICNTFKFSNFVVESLLSAGSPYRADIVVSIVEINVCDTCHSV